MTYHYFGMDNKQIGEFLLVNHTVIIWTLKLRGSTNIVRVGNPVRTMSDRCYVTSEDNIGSMFHTYCEVHEAKEFAQHLNHWTEAEAWQRLTHVLR